MSETKQNAGFWELINEHATTIIAVFLAVASIIGASSEQLEEEAQHKSEIAQQKFKEIDDDAEDCELKIGELMIEKENATDDTDKDHLEDVENSIKFYTHRKDSLEKQAKIEEGEYKKLEAIYTRLDSKSDVNQYGSIFFQIAVLFSSVAVSTKKRALSIIAGLSTLFGIIAVVISAFM